MSCALKTSMTVPSFIISTNLLAALETHFDLWEDLLYLSALQQAIKIDTPENKAVQITQSKHLASSWWRQMPTSSLYPWHKYSTLPWESWQWTAGFVGEVFHLQVAVLWVPVFMVRDDCCIQSSLWEGSIACFTLWAACFVLWVPLVYSGGKVFCTAAKNKSETLKCNSQKGPRTARYFLVFKLLGLAKIMNDKKL